MDIKDLAGIGEPIKKLIEVVSAGLGRMYEAHSITKKADAKAIELDVISKAFTKNNYNLGTATYIDGKLTVNADGNSSKPSSITDRTISRIIAQEEKREINTENIINNAASELNSTDFVSPEKVDEDWISRFFEISSDITSNEMQLIWGKILAGEITKPNSFSLRTLEFIRNLSTKEANLIAIIANATFSNSIKTEHYIINDREFLKNEFNINYGDIILLEEIGFIREGLTYTINVNTTPIPMQDYFSNGNLCTVFTREPNNPKNILDIYLITKMGNELLSILNINSNIEVIKNLASKIKNEKISVISAKIIENLDAQIRYDKIEDL